MGLPQLTGLKMPGLETEVGLVTVLKTIVRIGWGRSFEKGFGGKGFELKLEVGLGPDEKLEGLAC